MNKIISFTILFLGLTFTAYCGQQSRIELTDGSVINGEIISFLNGIYTINTASFGEIKIEAAKVSRIEASNAVSGASSAPLNQKVNLTPDQLNNYSQEIMSNPDNAAIITNLASDPEIQAVARDPEIQRALKAGDIDALSKNEKFQSILNNPKVQEAVGDIKQ